jgi:hypothetical protein
MTFHLVHCAASPSSPYKSNLLTQWSRILFEKLIVAQPVKKFLASCGTRRFVTVFTRACILSQMHPVRAVSLSFCKIHSNIISLPKSFLRIHQSPRPCVTTFHKKFRSCYSISQASSWRTTLYRLSATVNSIYSKLPSIPGGRILHPELEDATCHGVRVPDNMGSRM